MLLHAHLALHRLHLLLEVFSECHEGWVFHQVEFLGRKLHCFHLVPVGQKEVVADSFVEEARLSIERIHVIFVLLGISAIEVEVSIQK